MKPYYLTTPLYYVNSAPHVGHAYTNIMADCMARYQRLMGKEVFFLTGTDEHGEKIKKAAQVGNQEVKDFVDQVCENFRSLWKNLEISHDYFIRTTDSKHVQTVKKVTAYLYEKGDIYQAKYKAFYCLPCESFWTDTQLKDAGNVCPECKRAVEEIEEENYFFRLSQYQKWLIDYIKTNPDFILPQSRYNEALGFLENNRLDDLCISRPKKRVSWGIECPFNSDYVIYVWFDALLNYISAIGYADAPEQFDKLWPADIQFMAKDILKQHAVFFPIMLKALSLPLPRSLFIHGWWKVGEEKMSKSRGNIVNPYDLISKITVDGLRYFLLREITPGADGNFSWPIILTRVNSDLANDLGNLVYRSLNMVEKYAGGKVDIISDIPDSFKTPFSQLAQQYIPLMEKVEFSQSLEMIFKCISAMNRYVEEIKPWTLVKEKKEQETGQFLYAMLEGLRIIAFYLFPFMPSSACSIRRQIGLPEIFRSADKAWGMVKNYTIKKETPLFPRIETDVD